MGVSTPAAVTVEIGELLVEGMDRPAAQRLSVALESELAQLIDRRGLPEGFAEGPAPTLELDDVEVDAGTPPNRLGRHLATALYRKLGQ